MNMIRVELELPRDLLIALNISGSDAGQKTKKWVALELFREGQISSWHFLLGMSKFRGKR
jgi:hypothetical protein